MKELGWSKPYFVDADHVQLTTVERFIQPCDFFTLDVADMIGQPASEADVDTPLPVRQDFLPGGNCSHRIFCFSWRS